jgi:hypothetical protein
MPPKPSAKSREGCEGRNITGPISERGLQKLGPFNPGAEPFATRYSVLPALLDLLPPPPHRIHPEPDELVVVRPEMKLQIIASSRRGVPAAIDDAIEILSRVRGGGEEGLAAFPDFVRFVERGGQYGLERCNARSAGRGFPKSGEERLPVLEEVFF